MNQKKVLLLNQGNTANYGDIAILDTMQKFFNNNNIQIDFHSFWDENDIFGKNYDNFSKEKKERLFKYNFILDFFYKKSIKKYIKNIKQYNAIIIGGGELIGPHKGFNSSFRIWSSIAKKYNIPLYLLGVSGDLNMSKSMLKRNKKSLNNCSFICVRDNYTQQIFENYYNVECICKPDVVFAYKKLLNLSTTPTTKKNTILFVPIDFNNTIEQNLKLKNKEEYKKYLLDILKQNLNNIDNIIITSTVLVDDNFSKECLSYLQENLNANINISYFQYTNINDYLNLLKETKLVISGRMHAMILALLYNCQILPIPFKEKLQTFRDEYSVSPNIEEIEKNALDGLQQIIYNLSNI